jgi:hypothetical protein
LIVYEDGEGDHAQATPLGLSQDVEISFVGLLEIVRCRRVQMRINRGKSLFRACSLRPAFAFSGSLEWETMKVRIP